MIIVFGPRTRLATACIARIEPLRSCLLVARDQHDRAELVRRHSARTVVALADVEDWPRTERPTTVVLAAFGAVHPTRAGDAFAALERDALAFERFVRTRTDVSALNVLLVSSVLALAPPRHRAEYGGAKNMAESSVERALERHPGATFAVLHPGRLVERKSLARPASLLATTYGDLAQRILDWIERPRPVDAVVGADARAWLVHRALALGVHALLPSSRRIPAVPREAVRPPDGPTDAASPGTSRSV